MLSPLPTEHCDGNHLPAREPDGSDPALPFEASASELKSALEMAERAARAKSDFLARMSHEIRTPMNAILAPAQLLAESPLSASQRELVEMLQRAGEHLLGVINDILDYSKLEAGKMRLSEAPFDPRALLDEIIAPFSILASRKGLRLEGFLDQNVSGWWFGDASRIRQVLLNLVSNAMKFTSSGSITVRIHPWNGEDGIDPGLSFSVRDTGTGLSLQETELIFLPFEQSGYAHSHRPGGTGLGLAICRELVDLMGGIIGVDSVPREGSEFWFRLPLRKLDAEHGMVGPITQENRQTVQLLWKSSPNALVVEDNAANRKILALMLKRLGVPVETAPDGIRGLEMMKEGRFDIVFMDCEMPILDGYEATAAFRGWESAAHLPIVALSAHIGDDHIHRCFAAGMDAVMSKPVSLRELSKVLSQYLPHRL